MAASAKYLTGDGAGIKDFLEKFDVRYFGLLTLRVVLTNCQILV